MFVLKAETLPNQSLRIFGFILFAASGAELYGLYLLANPTHWLANLHISIADGSFRSLSLFGFIGAVVGAMLAIERGWDILLAVAAVILMWTAYHFGLVKFGNTKTAITAPTVSSSSTLSSSSDYTVPEAKATSKFINTGEPVSANGKKWCEKDDDGDGKLNKFEDEQAQLNCSTGFKHKPQ